MSIEYQHDFERYELARQRYMDDLNDIRELLARFTGQPAADEAPLAVADIARLEGLRIERDLAYADFVKTEAEIFRQLIDRLFPPDPTKAE
jgi:hypothetical protein